MEFQDLLAALESLSGADQKRDLITIFLAEHTVPVVEGEWVHFLFRGGAGEVAVPNEMNKWDPVRSRMTRIGGTDLFYRSERFCPDGRLEYKIWTDGTWILDPLNKRRAPGGYGENSDVWMGGYSPPLETCFDPAVPHGTIHTLYAESRHLGRTHPLYVYVPAEAPHGVPLPSLYVLDGLDYLSFGLMGSILDNLIARRSVRPLIAVFVEPRTDPNNPGTNHRMTDYAASDTFTSFLADELIPLIGAHYPVDGRLSHRVIMGESMGGLMSTYIVLKHTDLFVKCAAQSPAYLQADGAVIRLLHHMTKANVTAFIDTGTINDTEEEATLVSELLARRDARVRLSKHPEGHNWSNWRSGIKDILEFFFPA
jgi:enterochelin esterase-like enzyme